MRQYIDTLQDANGNALVGATVLVQNYVGAGNASIFSDNGLTPISTSTVATGADGQFSFFVADGDYNLVMAKNATVFKTQAPVSVFDGAAQVTQADTGAVNAYATSSSVLEKALRTGLRAWINVVNSNTGPATFAYNGLAAKAIVNAGNTALTAGQLLAGSIYQLEYNGTAWQLAAPPGPSYFGITGAEIFAGVTPTNFTFPAGNAFRYGADGTGTVDSTAALNAWVQAAWAMYHFPDGQDLWNGAGGAIPVLQLPPGKFMLSGPIYVPAACTVRGTGHPANTTSHTRLIMTSASTGLTPGRTWTANATIPPGARINTGAGYNYQTTSGGVSGSSVPAWGTSAGTVTDGTVTWTFNAANTTGDNRNQPMFLFGRGTQPRVGTWPSSGPNGILADSAHVTCLQELEFWYVSIGAGFSNPLSGSGYAVNDYPLGAILYYDVDAADTRFVDCCFQSSPCAIKAVNVGTTNVTRGDGFTGNRGIGIFFENCEFDAASAHVIMTGCALNLWFKECLFFNTSHFYGNCSGILNYLNCYWEFGSQIAAPFLDCGLTFGANSFTSIAVKGSIVEPPSNFPWVYINSPAACIDISQNSLYSAATQGGIFVNGANAGRISNNVLNNQGFNAPAGSGVANFVAAINAQNCQNLQISDNQLCANNTGGTYGGFGILTCTNGGTTSAGNVVTGNTVTAPYNGAAFTNGGIPQNRLINLAPGDLRGMNYEGGVKAMRVGAQYTPLPAVAYSASITLDCSQGNEFDVPVTNATAFTINNPTNGNAGQNITVQIRNATGGSIGAITWGSAFKMLGFTNPIAGGSCTLSFRYDGTNWTQITPQTAQVPN